jgi:ribosomal protein S27AE
MTEAPLITYGDGPTFERTCPKCGRFVKADKTIKVNGFDEVVKKKNATCKRCGRVEMILIGYF